MHDGQALTRKFARRADNRSATFPLNRPILLQYLGGFEPPAIRARGGLLVTAIAVILLLPAEGGAVVVSMAVVSGQVPVWPAVGQGLIVLAIVGGIFAGAPLLGISGIYRWPDAGRWILLAFLVPVSLAQLQPPSCCW
jgi:hypothetical protein